jgi:hypothetical protein
MAWQVPTDVAAFVRAFEAGTLPKAQWTHEAHLLVALWYLGQHDAATTLRTLQARIRAYNDAVGTPNSDSSGYHETLTQLYVQALAVHRGAAAHDEPFARSLQRLLDSPLARRDWPLRHYSRERLFSVAARRNWVEPDLLPLDAGDAQPGHG